MLQGHSPMVNNQYYLTQSMIPSISAPRPIARLTIPQTFGSHIPGPHSASPPHTPYQWYTPQSSPPPPSQMGSGYLSVSDYHRFE